MVFAGSAGHGGGRSPGGGGGLLPWKQNFYLPLSYTYPLDDNKSAIGLDVLTHPIVKDSVNKAIKSKKHIITPLLSLAQQQDKYTGAIIYYPIFKNAPNNQDKSLQGLVEVVLELDILLAALHKKMKTNNQRSVEFFKFPRPKKQMQN